MYEKKSRRLPVVDEKNKLAGIISRADILRAVHRKLE
jgi:CBS domain-containing protein